MLNVLGHIHIKGKICFEPFSKIHGELQGRTAIKAFLEVALMASDGL
jgi:hypothetical protein